MLYYFIKKENIMNAEESYALYHEKVIRYIINKSKENYPLPNSTSDFYTYLSGYKCCTHCDKCCCEHFPCKYSPYDFLDITNFDYMCGILDTGLLCISESINTKELIIRPRGINDSDSIVSLTASFPFWISRNPCLLLSSTGCMLPPEFRPSEGLLYIPKSTRDHISLYSEKDLEKDYEQYQDALKALYDKYSGKYMPKVSSPSRVRKLTKHISEL